MRKPSNAQEAKARDSRLIGVAQMNDHEASETLTIFPVPAVEELLSPILTVIPLQLLAYHIAARRGLDVDQPELAEIGDGRIAGGVVELLVRQL